ncbi:MAG: STAS domain-containing protein [Actinobacteria bacterium]|nr:STAS domain-containing protein [Actinomycetota bacterium]
MTPYELEVVDSDRENVTLLELRGELDLTNASDVERQVTGLAGGRPGLVLDLNSVAFIDSAALQMLFRLARRFDGPQLGLVLAPGALVARTLAIVGLGEVASIGSTVDELVVEPRS